MADCVRIAGNALFLEVKVIPGASKSQVAGTGGGRLRLRIAAAPEDGKANACLRSFLAKLLDCPKKELVLVKGEKSPLKTIALPLSRRERLEEIIQALEP
jgi:uncharacterized protein (TIGR00251 family)